MTNILNLPVYGFDIAAQTNESLLLSLAYVDDQVVSVTVYNGGSAYGGAAYTGQLAVYFSPPVSGGGAPALGIANVVSGVVTGIAINLPGSGYMAQEVPVLTIPGNSGNGLIVAVNIGNPIALDGLTLDFEVRPEPLDNGDPSPVVTIFASNQIAPTGSILDGTISTATNVLNLSVPESAMFAKLPGSYVYEIRAQADSFTKVIAKGNFPLSQGVAYERG